MHFDIDLLFSMHSFPPHDYMDIAVHSSLYCRLLLCTALGSFNIDDILAVKTVCNTDVGVCTERVQGHGCVVGAGQSFGLWNFNWLSFLFKNDIFLWENCLCSDE